MRLWGKINRPVSLLRPRPVLYRRKWSAIRTRQGPPGIESGWTRSREVDPIWRWTGGWRWNWAICRIRGRSSCSDPECVRQLWWRNFHLRRGIWSTVGWPGIDMEGVWLEILLYLWKSGIRRLNSYRNKQWLSFGPSSFMIEQTRLINASCLFIEFIKLVAVISLLCSV